MLSLVFKTDTPWGRHLTSHPALKDPSSERRKKNDFHEVYVAPSNVAKCLVVEASKYLREGFWKRGPEWSWGGSRKHHHSFVSRYDTRRCYPIRQVFYLHYSKDYCKDFILFAVHRPIDDLMPDRPLI